MGLRRLSVVAVAVCSALVAGCTDNGSTNTASGDQEVPFWILEGVRLARDTKSSWSTEDGSSNRPSIPTITETNTSKLPDRAIVVGGLAALGLTEVEANCMYDNLAANDDAADTAVALLGALSSLGDEQTASPAALGALTTVNEESMTRLVWSIAPCLSPASLTTIVLGAQTLSPELLLGGLSGASLAGLNLGGLQGVDLSALASLNLDPAAIGRLIGSVDLSALANLAAADLGPLAVSQLEALLKNLLNTNADLGSILADPALLLNLDQLDLSKIPADQMPLIFLAIARGLTPNQQRQLQNIANVTFDDLELAIDPSTLSSEEIGGLLLILAPLLAAAVRGENTPPEGWDPNEIYLPPDTDLSELNPLLFIDRNSVIDSFVKGGVDPKLGTCLFDSLRDLEPRTLALLFSSVDPSPAISSILLAAFVCVLRV